MKRLVCTLCAVLLLGWACPAGASQLPAGMLDAARQSWPTSPCLGREQIGIWSQEQIVAATGDERVGGIAWPQQCRFVIADRLLTAEYLYQVEGRMTACQATAHELGHLAGVGHVEDPNNLMHPAPGLQSTPPACADWAQNATWLNPPPYIAPDPPPPTMSLAEARDAVRAEHRLRVTVACRWTRPRREARCISAARRSTRVRRWVWKVTAAEIFPRVRPETFVR